ncbi:Uncharacterised protein [uncultured archaeon]|nr:Uncharacterised protein [uncultured archaeon]
MMLAEGSLRVSHSGKVMVKAAVAYHQQEPTEFEMLDRSFVVERSL